MTAMRPALLILLGAALLSHAQTKFEAASVKPSDPASAQRGTVVDPGRFAATGVALIDLIRYAYGFDSLASQSQVSGGPSWIATNRFDILATSKGQPTLEMLKALLEERFKVKAHVESREQPVFLMLPERKELGPKIHPSTSTCEGPGLMLPRTSSSTAATCGVRGRPGSYMGEGTSMAQIARALGNFPAIGRVVLDRTSLAGFYDWTLQWTPAFNANPTPGGPAVANPDTEATGSIFTALREQLGLKLEAQRAPVDILVIERAELPTPD